MAHCKKCGSTDAVTDGICANCRNIFGLPAGGEVKARQYAISAAGRARAAAQAGARLFQVELTLSETTGSVVPMAGTQTSTTRLEQSNMLEAIEAEGWRLEHAGYVFRLLRSVSRDKLLSSGQQEAVSGEVVGVYIFRRVDR